nr:immunoglobulin heavy chain junction region [Mus musculus]
CAKDYYASSWYFDVW